MFLLQRMKFQSGDLVIGDIKSFGWWFGMIATGNLKPSSRNLVWVYWYGDHKTLEVRTVYQSSYVEASSLILRYIIIYLTRLKCAHHISITWCCRTLNLYLYIKAFQFVSI